MMRLTENLNVFFTDFATTATLADGTTVEVIFDYKYSEFLSETEGREVTALLPAQNLGAIAIADVIEIDSRAFEVQSIQPQNDEKITELLLKEL